MKVNSLLIGHYGSGNFGDDIMLQFLIDEYRTAKKSFKVVFFDTEYKQFNLDNEQVILIDRRNSFLHIKNLIKNLWDCENIVWGGGTCFTDEEGDGYFIGMLVAWLLRKNIVYRSVGIGNLAKTTRKLKFKILMCISSFVSFRENTSLELAKKMCNKKNYLIEEDLGDQFLEGTKEVDNNENNKGLLICWRDLDSYGGYNLETITNHIDLIIKDNIFMIKITLLDIDNKVDHTINAEIFNLLKKKYSNYNIKHAINLSYKEKLTEIKKSSIILTARLHVLIASIIYEKQVYIYSYSPKIDFVLKNQINNLKVKEI